MPELIHLLPKATLYMSSYNNSCKIRLFFLLFTDRKRQDSELETLWFRAATIAVPIAGGFILIVLVLLASKMLAKESKRRRMAQVLLKHAHFLHIENIWLKNRYWLVFYFFSNISPFSSRHNPSHKPLLGCHQSFFPYRLKGGDQAP